MRRMLDPKEAGGSLPSTIKFDEEGNRTVGKNLGVDGKLTLKSLVSNTNPDGDITKELGGGGGTPRHVYDIIINGTCQYTAYTTKDLNLKIGEQTQVNDFATNDEYKELRTYGKHFATGYFELTNSKKRLVFDFEFYGSNLYRVWGTYTVSNSSIDLELEYCEPFSWQVIKRI